MRPYRVGVVGAGFIADFHMRALRSTPGVEIAAVCDANLARARAFQQRWGLPAAFESIDAMNRAQEPDVIHVVTPPPSHHGVALQCLAAGRHVFIEKPMALDLRECDGLVQAAGTRVVGVNHNAVYHPAYVKLLKLVANGVLGGVEHVIACVNVPLRQLNAGQHTHWMFQRPGNIILEQAPHPLSQILLLVGPSRSASALASGEVRLNTGASFYTNWQISLQCSTGTAQCFLGFGKTFYSSWLTVIGEDAVAVADLRRNTVQMQVKSHFIDPVDHLLAGFRTASSTASQAFSNMMNYARNFVRPRLGGDAFSASFAASIRTFYNALRCEQESPTDLHHGCDVIAACEHILAGTTYATQSGESLCCTARV